MANYYELLEVSEKASKEVIEKAYRVLAKKNHPDLQAAENKEKAEATMKKINEAYEILGNDEKRRQYDETLENKRQVENNINRQQNNIKVNQQQNNVNNGNQTNEYYKQQEEYYRRQREIELQKEQNVQSELRRVYSQAYNDYWTSRGYKIKEPWTWERIKKLMKVLGILLIIILVLWFFPPTNKLIVEFYESNVIVKAIIDIFIGIITGIGKGIYQFFTSL